MDKDVSKDAVFIETTIHASVEEMWAAWTEPGVIMKWFGSDPNGEVLSAEVDLWPGGNFEVSFKAETQKAILCERLVGFISLHPLK